MGQLIIVHKTFAGCDNEELNNKDVKRNNYV